MFDNNTDVYKKYRGLFSENFTPMWEDDLTAVFNFLNSLKNEIVTTLHAYCNKNPPVILTIIDKIIPVDLNNSALKLFNISDKSIFFRNKIQILGKNTYFKIAQAIIDLFEEKEVNPFLVTIFTIDGKRFDADLQITRISSPDSLSHKAFFSITDSSSLNVLPSDEIDTSNRYRDLVDQLPLIVFEVDKFGYLTYLNQSGKNYLGINQNDINNGYNVLECFPLEEHSRVLHFLRVSTKGDDSITEKNREFRVFDKNGNIFPTMIYSSIIPFKESIHGRRGILFDISDFKKIQSETIAIETQYKRLIDLSPDAICVINSKGNFLTGNNQLVKLFNYDSLKELLTHNLSNLVSKSEHSKLLNSIEKTIETGNIKNIEFKLKKKSNHFFHGELSISCIIDDVDSSPQFLVIIRDISNMKRAEELLKTNVQRTRILLNASKDIAFLIDVDTKILVLNEQAEKFLGVNLKEALGTSLPEVLPEKLKSEYLDDIVGTFSTGKPTTFEYDDRGNFHTFTVHPVFDNFQKVEQVAIFIRNISEQKIIEQQKIDIATRRNRFIETTAHEIRTPLTIIKGFLEVIQENQAQLDDERLNRSLELIKSNVKRLETLANDVRDISRIDREELRLDKKELNFCEFITSQANYYQQILGDKFSFVICKSEPIFINIDPERIGQVIQNLINNAVHHTPEKIRKITLRSEVDEDSKTVNVSIADNGAGILEDHMDQIFKQFTSIETKYYVKGTGIGLYLSKYIIESHDGSISVESEGLDRGATFTFRLPYIEKN